MTTMPMPQLNVRCISASLMRPLSRIQSQTGSRRQARGSSRTPRPSGSTRGTLSVSPPPVMCASPWTSIAAARPSNDFT